MENLSRRQQQVLEFINSYLSCHGYPPSFRDISAHLGISGNAAVLVHLQALEKKGYIRRDQGSSRGIAIIGEKPSEMVQVPILGAVRAGLPTLAVEDIEGYHPLGKMQLRGGSFFLRVKGDSMINDAIVDGDLALVRSQSMADNGDIVVAMIDGEATLKRFYLENGQIRLQPRNPNMEAIIVPAGESVSIIGKVIKIVRDI